MSADDDTMGVVGVQRAAKSGSMPAGPSSDYLRLIRGELSPREYVKRVKKQAVKPRSAAFR
jgi:hypothetical protein